MSALSWLPDPARSRRHSESRSGEPGWSRATDRSVETAIMQMAHEARRVLRQRITIAPVRLLTGSQGFSDSCPQVTGSPVRDGRLTVRRRRLSATLMYVVAPGRRCAAFFQINRPTASELSPRAHDVLERPCAPIAPDRRPCLCPDYLISQAAWVARSPRSRRLGGERWAGRAVQDDSWPAKEGLLLNWHWPDIHVGQPTGQVIDHHFGQTAAVHQQVAFTTSAGSRKAPSEPGVPLLSQPGAKPAIGVGR